jgi:hypothetical protein
MFREYQYDSRRFWFGCVGAAACIGMFFMALPGMAADVIRVEEEWELAIATPDPGSDAPQVTCLISPSGDMSHTHAVFELNQRTQPSVSPGGLQLQVWRGESPLSHVEASNAAVLGQADETIRWTQKMELAGGMLTFAVTDGHSTTWGDFGQAAELQIQRPTLRTNLNFYNPAVSAQNSAVGYAANRVRSLALKRVRYTSATGQVWEDSTVRLVHTLP